MALSDNLTGRIADIDTQVQRIKDESREHIAALLRQRAILVNALSIVTPEIEAAFNALKEIGVIR